MIRMSVMHFEIIKYFFQLHLIRGETMQRSGFRRV